MSWASDDRDAEIYSILCDFFEREVFQPERLADDDGFLHTSAQARALTNALLRRLDEDGLLLR